MLCPGCLAEQPASQSGRRGGRRCAGRISVPRFQLALPDGTRPALAHSTPVMNRLFPALVVAAGVYLVLGSHGGLRQWIGEEPVPRPALQTAQEELQQLNDAFHEQRSGIQVTGQGVVTQSLPDDNRGSRHQRFVLTLPTGQTLLVAHNIDLAPRIPGLHPGDRVAFHGEYEWNPKGGVVHWTHRDPKGQHAAGWLEFKGKVYQ
jgi:hypothetical protein